MDVDTDLKLRGRNSDADAASRWYPCPASLVPLREIWHLLTDKITAALDFFLSGILGSQEMLRWKRNPKCRPFKKPLEKAGSSVKSGTAVRLGANFSALFTTEDNPDLTNRGQTKGRVRKATQWFPHEPAARCDQVKLAAARDRGARAEVATATFNTGRCKKALPFRGPNFATLVHFYNCRAR